MSTTTPEHTLTHTPECAASRQLDVTTYPEGVTTLQCVDCGAHQAFTAAGSPIAVTAEPGAYHSDEPRPGVLDGITLQPATTKRGKR